jgi:ribosome biogenesis GTPase
LLDAGEGELRGFVSGRFRNQVLEAGQYPVPGDQARYEFVEQMDEVRITAIEPRRNRIVRKMPISGGRKMHNGLITGGTTQEQVLAANVDTAFILAGLDGNYSLPRLERYLVMIRHAQVPPVILLTKADCCDDTSSYIEHTTVIAPGVPVHAVSAYTGEGMDIVRGYLEPGRVVVFLGSSGVGKSTLLNTLYGQEVQTVRTVSGKTGKGRHTTTNRQLFRLPGGASVIDTPGIRELQLWVEEEDLDQVYADIVELAIQCRFSDCTHRSEPGCAVRAAIRGGRLSEPRLERYRSEQREVEHLHKRQTAYLRRVNRKSREDGINGTE